MNPRKRQEGFTFNEVLAAMGLIVVALLGYSLSSVSVIRDQTANDNLTIAIHLAQDKVEQLKTQPNPLNENRCAESGERGISALATPGGIFDRCWSVVDSWLGSSLKQIDVTVAWRDYQPREITLSTLVFTDGDS